MSIFEKLVSRFGSQVKAAEALGVKQGTVSGWVSGKHGMSAVTAIRAERVTKGEFKAEELCPDLEGAA
ncbi:Cro/CI family transcriptional regulator [Pseudomonas sp. LjRoot71]|uniref:transcriptional regulator n=1 Tax=Pseudomonas sp. LjRoot71 TaxID=3342336 RepID=UPI003ECD1F37